jgi:hypothetical protein
MLDVLTVQPIAFRRVPPLTDRCVQGLRCCHCHERITGTPARDESYRVFHATCLGLRKGVPGA